MGYYYDHDIHTHGGMCKCRTLIPSGVLDIPIGVSVRMAVYQAEKEVTMILEQYYIECLSHASYMIGDETTGRAIVGPLARDDVGRWA